MVFNQHILDTFGNDAHLASPSPVLCYCPGKVRKQQIHGIRRQVSHRLPWPCFEAFRPVAIHWNKLFDSENTTKVTLRLIKNHILMSTELFNHCGIRCASFQDAQQNPTLVFIFNYLEDAPDAVPASKASLGC